PILREVRIAPNRLIMGRTSPAMQESSATCKIGICCATMIVISGADRIAPNGRIDVDAGARSADGPRAARAPPPRGRSGRGPEIDPCDVPPASGPDHPGARPLRL